MSFNANRELFKQIKFRGKPMLFTILTIERKTLPDGIERYEIRHADKDDRCPIQIARNVFSNHFGTLLTNEPIQLTPDSVLSVSAKDFEYAGRMVVSLAEYLKEYPPKEKEVFEMVRGIAHSEREWFYSAGQKNTERGYLGCLAGRLEENNAIQSELIPQTDAVSDLQSELKKVIGWLRQGSGPLNSVRSLTEFCFRYSRGMRIIVAAYGFRIDALNYVHYLRCLPEHKAFEIHSYDRAAREAFIVRESRKTDKIKKERCKNAQVYV